jgi:hypothetical protein
MLIIRKIDQPSFSQRSQNTIKYVKLYVLLVPIEEHETGEVGVLSACKEMDSN